MCFSFFMCDGVTLIGERVSRFYTFTYKYWLSEFSGDNVRNLRGKTQTAIRLHIRADLSH